MDDVVGCFEFYADLAEKLDARQKTPVSLPMDTFKSHVLRKPIPEETTKRYSIIESLFDSEDSFLYLSCDIVAERMEFSIQQHPSPLPEPPDSTTVPVSLLPL
ncbi:hypothetical protein RYX36_017098 [Vicia faba]